MNKFLFWFYMFIGLMLCFFKFEVGQYVTIDKPYMAIMNLILALIVISVLVYGTPNGFIRGFKNMKKGENTKR
jgi:hypothetical protein